MILYSDQETAKHYNAHQLIQAERLNDHATEPSWGVYEIGGTTAVICDCDVDDAKDRAFTVRGTTWVYEGVEE